MAGETQQTQHPSLTGFKALSFDCYGTLIDWEGGMLADLQPILSQLPSSHPFVREPSLAIQRYNTLSEELEAAEPALLYDTNLTRTFLALAAEAGVPSSSDLEAAAQRFGSAPGRWPAFPDTVPGLRQLARHYKLIILSNVSNASIAAALAGPLDLSPAGFAAVYTAQDIGSYKPAHANFAHLFRRARDDLGVRFEDGELLHVARSLTADHVPAKELGLRSVWIARGGDQREGYGTGGDYEKLKGEGRLGFEWKFDSIGDFAREVERQFGELEAKKNP